MTSLVSASKDFAFALSFVWIVRVSNYCRRNRGLSPGEESSYYVDPASVRIEESGCKMDLLNRETNVALTVEIYSLVDNGFRLKMNEKTPIRKRYEVEGSLVKEPEMERCVRGNC